MQLKHSPRLTKFLVAALLSYEVVAGGSQNPFDPNPQDVAPSSGGGGGGGGGGSQNPFAGGSGGSGNTGGSGGGSQNPFAGGGGGGSSGGGGSQNPFDPGNADQPTNPDAPVKGTYSCPEDNGERYTTGGITFELKCNAGTAARPLRSTPSYTLTDCADQCAKDPACMSCDWSPNSCNMKAEYIPTFAAPYMTWFPVTDRSQQVCPATRETTPNPNAQVTNNPTCPSGNGQLYTADDGTSFYLQCCVHASGTTVLKESQASSLKDCMDQCTAVDDCKSVRLNARPQFGATAADPGGNCVMYKEGDFSTTACGNNAHDSAFAATPPTSEQSDDAGIKCSTDCPFANGQQYASTTGEAFHIDCGLRHGTSYLYIDTQPTFKDCMDACGALIPCHSVDYERRTKTCFYSNHHGEPVVIASGFSSAHTVGCTGGCGECSKGCGK